MAFIRRGSIVTAERTTVAEWRNMIVAADTKQNPLEVEALNEFELDKNGFVYVRIRDVSCVEMHGPNQNGDAFTAAGLEAEHRTFIRRGVFINHDSESPDRAIGIILDSSWHPKEGFVQLLLAIDKNEPIAAKIAKGVANTWSMGAIVEKCECSVPSCKKVAHTEEEYCDHLANHMGEEIGGHKVYATNIGCNYYEVSNVTVPADPNAYTLQVFANKKDGKWDAYKALSDKYLRQVEAATRKAETDVLQDIKGKLAKNVSKPKTQEQILGKVRHTLKAVRAKLTPRESVSLHRRVESALAVGHPAGEPTNNNLEIKVEGIIMKKQFTIRYIPGDNLKSCYFIARKGNLQASISAAAVLDEKAQTSIVASERPTVKAQKPATRIKDDSKPSPDNTLDVGKEEAQPGPKTNVGDSVTEIKDDSKPSPDNKHELGKEPSQPSDVVKRFAQMVGAKNITFKKGANGSFTAHLSGGSISRLSSLWNTTPRVVKALAKKPVRKKAKVGGESPVWAREPAKPIATDPKEKMTRSWEDKDKEAAKPAGSSGGEIKSYFQKLDSKNLSQGGGEAWARKVAEMTTVGKKLTTALSATEASLVAAQKQLKAFKVENDTLKKSLDATKQAAVEEKKAVIVGKILEYMEKAGALRVDENALFAHKEAGLNHEDAQVKAYAEMIERKKAELKELGPKALATMYQNFQDFVPGIKAHASRKDLKLPRPSRDSQPSADEDTLAANWD